MTSNLFAAGAAVALLAACGRPDAGLRVAAEATGSSQSALGQGQSALSFNSSDGTSFELTMARVNFRHIEVDLPSGEKCSALTLEAPVECKNSSSGTPRVFIPGPIVVNLLTGESTPDLRKVAIPAGVYKRIDFRIDDAKDQGLAATDPLNNNSFVATASFVRNGQPSTLSLALSFNEDLRVEEAEGVQVSGDEGELLLLLKPDGWLSDIPVIQCLNAGDLAVDSSGVVLLDERAKGSCSGVEDSLKRNIKRSLDLDRN